MIQKIQELKDYWKKGWIPWVKNLRIFTNKKRLNLSIDDTEFSYTYDEVERAIKEFSESLTGEWNSSDYDLFLQYLHYGEIKFPPAYTDLDEVFKYTFKDLNHLYKDIPVACAWIKYQTYVDDGVDIVDSDDKEYRINYGSLKRAFLKLSDEERRSLIDGLFYYTALSDLVKIACEKEV